MDRALLHIRAASSVLNATEVTSGSGDVTVGKEVPVPRPNLGTRKRTRQNNLKLPTQNSTNGENVPRVRTRRMEVKKRETLR